MGWHTTGLEDAGLIALGKVAAAASWLEAEFEHLAMDLVSPDRVHAVTLIGPLSFERRAELVKVLARRRLSEGDPRLMELEEVVNRSLVVMRERNRILHAEWDPNWSGSEWETRARTRPRKPGQSSVEFENEKSLLDLADRLLTSGGQIGAVYMASLEWSGAFHKTATAYERRSDLF